MDGVESSRAALSSQLASAGFADASGLVSQMETFVVEQCPLMLTFNALHLVANKPRIQWLTEAITLGDLNNPEAINRAQLNLFNDPYVGCLELVDASALPCSFVFDRSLRASGVLTLENSEIKTPFHRDAVSIVLNALFCKKQKELESFARLVTGQHPCMESFRDLPKIGVEFSNRQVTTMQVTHLVIHPLFNEFPRDLRLLFNFALKCGCFIVTPKSLRQAAEMRLWSEKRLKAYLTEHRVNFQGVVQNARSSQLLCGTKDAARQTAYHFVVQYLCSKEMAEISVHVAHAGVDRWLPEQSSLALAKKDAAKNGDSTDEEDEEDEEEEEEEEEAVSQSTQPFDGDEDLALTSNPNRDIDDSDTPPPQVGGPADPPFPSSIDASPPRPRVAPPVGVVALPCD